MLTFGLAHPPRPALPHRLLAAYPGASSRYDEMLEAPARPRPHWRAMFERLLDAPEATMRERVREIERQVRDNGVTYNVYTDPLGTDRPWDLDLLPQILPQDEWTHIAAAVCQRADLLNRILADIYGPQELVAQGYLPPALVHGNAGFLRPCHDVRPASGVLLHLYAADLARSPDGRWWVVADRTQSPSGAGYALENRLAISRAFPDLFRDLKVQPLAPFFATLRDSLAHWAPGAAGKPLIVLLTPGPYNETYYEHALLARYLGFPLVEGHDLTVRNGCVWLKTLSGLQRVHVILRRLDDDFCDPLELRADSALGIAGLTDAARRGNVLVANGLGAGLIESGAMLGYLPAIARHLSGAPLLMPSIATWWCGESAALEEVERALDRLVIKPAFPQMRTDIVFGQDLDEKARAALIARLRAHPHNFIAQELVRISQAPVWDRTHHRSLKAGAIGLRVYACATPNGYVAMPGGLTRVATGPDERVVSMQRGGGSKDTWVLSSVPVSRFSLLRRAVGPADLVRSPHNLSSRTAENLFWLGRYAERCDDSARLLRVSLTQLLDAGQPSGGRERDAVVALCRAWNLLPATGAASRDAIETALRRAVGDDEVPGLASNLRQLFRIAFQLRERLSADNWRTLNRLTQGHELRESRVPTMAEALAELDRVAETMMTLAGFALDGMTRDAGWRFMSIGRRIERMQFLCALLREGLAMREDADLDWMLELADSIVTYRSRYMARPQWLPVLDLLLADDSNPRSVAFQLGGLIDYLRRLEALYGACGAHELEPLRDELLALTGSARLTPDNQALPDLVGRLYQESFALANRLHARFFSHAGEADHGVAAP